MRAILLISLIAFLVLGVFYSAVTFVQLSSGTYTQYPTVILSLILTVFFASILYWFFIDREGRFATEVRHSRVLIVSMLLFLLVGILCSYGNSQRGLLSNGSANSWALLMLVGYGFSIGTFMALYWIFVLRNKRQTDPKVLPKWEVNRVLEACLIAFVIISFVTVMLNYFYFVTFTLSASNMSCQYLAPQASLGYGIFGVFNSGASLGGARSLCPVAAELVGVSSLKSALTILLIIDIIFGLAYWGFEVRPKEKKSVGGRGALETILIAIGVVALLFVAYLACVFALSWIQSLTYCRYCYTNYYPNPTIPTTSVSTTTVVTTTSIAPTPISKTASVPTAVPAALPSYLNKVVSLTLVNSQNNATSNPFDQMVVVNSGAYASYEAVGLNNVAFFYSNGTMINSWLESGNTAQSNATVYWLRLTSSVPAHGNTTVYMGFANKTANLFNGETVGEAPNLSSTYGQYDNGAKVFIFYDNFAGSSLNMSKWIGSGSVNNGVSDAGMSTRSVWNPANTILEWDGYLTSGAVSGGNYGTYLAGLPNQNNNQWLFKNGAECGYGYYWQETYSYGNPDCSKVGKLSSTNPFLVSMSGKGSLRTYFVAVNYGALYASSMAPSFSQAGLVNFYIQQGQNYFRFVRTRPYPPNGVMPSVS